ncbi:MAG: DUF2846 domain-containing protein [Candidatus Zixiibacteriota bacterium]
MRRVLTLVAVIIMVIGLGACASGPKFSTLKIDNAVPNAEMGRLFLYRITGMAGAAVQPDIILNGEKVGVSLPMGFFFLDLKPGEYKIATSTEVTRTVSLILEKGQNKYVRFSLGFGFFVGHVYGELVDEAEALKEIQECSLDSGLKK